MTKIKRLKVTNVKKLDEFTIAFELEEEEVTTEQIFEEYERAIADYIDKGILKQCLEDSNITLATLNES